MVQFVPTPRRLTTERATRIVPPMVEEAQQAQKTQQARILEAAKALFLSQGYNGSNLRVIAREAKVSMGGIYHHFTSMEEIYKTLLQQSDVAQDMFQILKLFFRSDEERV